MNQHEVQQKIAQAIEDAYVQVTGEGCSFEVAVESPVFQGKSRLDCQRMVLDLFQDDIKSGALHALTVKCATKF